MKYSKEIKDFVFDKAYRSEYYPFVGKWLYGCAFFTAIYVIFALILIGVPSLSRGAIVTVLMGLSWAFIGIIFKKKQFPLVLCLPLFFYSITVFFGFFVENYPIEAVGKLTTAWLGVVMIAIFVANGISLRFVILCFSLIIVANLLATALGYDGRLVNALAEGKEYYLYQTTRRISALAGQTNLLVALVFTFPFSLFLFRKSLGIYVLMLCTLLCVSFMFLTASRSSLPFTALFLTLGGLFFVKTQKYRLVSVISGVSLFIVGIYLVFSYSVVQFFSQPVFSDIEFVRRVVEVLNRKSGSVDHRMELASGFTQYFFRQPFVGYGPDQFKVIVGYGSYAHNNPVELLVNYGLVGSFTYYSMYLYVSIKIFRYWPYNSFLLAPLLFLISTEFVYVTHVERPFALLLCLLLLTSINVTSQVQPKRFSFY